MTDKKSQANYILNTVGITLPGYKRSDLKIGKCVTLDEKVGDGYAKRGFLTKGDKVASVQDHKLEALKKENDELKKELEALKKDKTLKNGKQ